MAIVTKGIAGPYVGRLGTSVGYMWKGKNCVRAYRQHICFPNTEEQLRERSWFVGMVRFASCATHVLRMGLRRQAAEAGMTEGNYFVMLNKRFFVRERGDFTVDYSKLKLSVGPAADVYFREPRFEADETVKVEFEKNSLSLRAMGDDQVYLYAYAPAVGRGLLSAPVARRSKQLSIRLPEEWSGLDVHLYGFVVDRDGRPSNSTYIGVGRVNHYEYRGRYIPLDKNWNDFVGIATEANAECVAMNDESTSDDAVSQGHVPSDVLVVDLFGDPPEVP